MKWRYYSSSRPKKLRIQNTAVKALTFTVFWACQGVIMINYLGKGRTMNGKLLFDVTDYSTKRNCGENLRKIVQICFVFVGQCNCTEVGCGHEDNLCADLRLD